MGDPGVGVPSRRVGGALGTGGVPPKAVGPRGTLGTRGRLAVCYQMLWFPRPSPSSEVKAVIAKLPKLAFSNMMDS